MFNQGLYTTQSKIKKTLFSRRSSQSILEARAIMTADDILAAGSTSKSNFTRAPTDAAKQVCFLLKHNIFNVFFHNSLSTDESVLNKRHKVFTSPVVLMV